MATFTDNFNRADVLLNADVPAYLDEAGLYPLRIVSNQFSHPITGFGIAASRYPTGCDTVTQYAKFTLTVTSAEDEALGVIVRADGSGTFYNLSVGSGFIGIEKYVNGAYSSIGDGSGQYFSTSNTNGDVFELRVSTNGGSVELRAYKNDSLITDLGTSGVLSDSAGDNILDGSYVGLFCYCNTESSSIRGDTWEGGDYSTGGGSQATVNPTRGELVISGKTADLNSFASVRVAEILINEAGSPVANRTGMHLLVWYAGIPFGSPDLSYSDATTGANGTLSYSLASGPLTLNQPIFYVLTDGNASGSLSGYTCARMVPTYS